MLQPRGFERLAAAAAYHQHKALQSAYLDWPVIAVAQGLSWQWAVHHNPCHTRPTLSGPQPSLYIAM